MIWATVSSTSCFCWLCSFCIISCKKYNQFNFSIYHLMMSMCRVISCVVGRGCLLWPVCSFGKTLCFCPASSCTLRPNLPVISGVFWVSTFAFLSPVMKRTSFLCVLVLEGVVGLHRTSQLQLTWHQWLGYKLGLLWCWMVYLETNWDHSVIFKVAHKMPEE